MTSATDAIATPASRAATCARVTNLPSRREGIFARSILYECERAARDRDDAAHHQGRPTAERHTHESEDRSHEEREGKPDAGSEGDPNIEVRGDEHDRPPDAHQQEREQCHEAIPDQPPRRRWADGSRADGSLADVPGPVR